MTASTQPTGRCAYVVGDDGLARWSDEHAAAWLGLLQTSRRLTRMLDRELERRHGLSLTGLELLGRLASADDRQLRLSTLATRSGLSPSRVSRIVDDFERRALVERVACPEDARGAFARLTDQGLQLVRDAQLSHVDDVRTHFFDLLEPDELEVLARVFGDFEAREHVA